MIKATGQKYSRTGAYRPESMAVIAPILEEHCSIYTLLGRGEDSV